MKHLNWLLYFYYAVAGFLAVISLVAAVLGDPDATAPDANTGFYAAFIVLCVTSIAVLETVKSSESLRRKCVAAGVGIGITASAYLLLADEANVHPANLTFLSQMGLVWLIAAAVVFIFFLFLLIARVGNKRK